MNNHKTYGLIGYPLGHSFSKSYFTKKFQEEGIDAQYLNFELASIESVDDLLSEHQDLAGFNVTIPYKEKIISFLDDIAPDAKSIGAVNVVKLYRKTSDKISLKGFNSDIVGFCNSISPMLKQWHTKALVFGTGGASRAVCQGLRNLGIEFTLVSRNRKPGLLCYDDIDRDTLEEYAVLINTTPVGMYPDIDRCLPLPYEAISRHHLCYDLIYNPDKTLFLEKAEKQGAQIKNGLEMLHLQADEAWRIWTDDKI